MSDSPSRQADVVAKIFDMRHLFLQCGKDADVSLFSSEQCASLRYAVLGCAALRGAWCLVLGSWFLVLGCAARFLVLGSWFLVLGAWGVGLVSRREHAGGVEM